MKTLACICAAALLPLLSLRAESNIHAVDRYAYAANVGWIDARVDGLHGAVIGLHYCSGALWSANAGWIRLGAGTPVNGWSYANDSATDWGVNHDGAGRLAGHAYGANIGWITFEQTHGQPRVDLLTGALSGYAWGANVGWIGLANSFAQLRVDTLHPGPDSDGDGIPDAWELQVAGNLTSLGGGGADWDGDGVSDADEYGADTNPFDNTSFLVITAFAREEGADSLVWPSQPTRLYRLMQTDSLQPAPPVWSESGLGLLHTESAALLAQPPFDPAATQRFYRVQALVPLAP